MKNLKWIKPLLILVAIVAVLVLGGKYLNLQQHIADALEWIKGLGPAGMGVYAGLYVFACIFFIPGSLLTLGAGAIFGLAKGVAYVFIAASIGATLAFLVSRYVARSAIEQRLAGNEKFSAIDDAVGRAVDELAEAIAS